MMAASRAARVRAFKAIDGILTAPPLMLSSPSPPSIKSLPPPPLTRVGIADQALKYPLQLSGG